MSGYYLCRHVFVCRVSSQYVLLDLRAHRYLAIDDERAVVLSHHVVGWRVGHDGRHPSADMRNTAEPRVLQELTDAGLLTRSAERGKPAVPPDLERKDALPALPYVARPFEVRPIDVLRFMLSLTRTFLFLRTRQMEHCVLRLPRIPPQCAQRAAAPILTAATQVRIFNRLRIWFYTAEGNCLADSLTAAHFLRQYGVPAMFVIGVRMHPFQAHSWVQLGSTILNDTLEFVQPFTPILVA